MSGRTQVTYVVSEIDRMRRDLDLDETVSALATQFLKQALDSGEVDIDSHDRLASTILHITCRQNGEPVVLDDLVAVTRPNVSRKGITRKAKRVQKALPIELELRDAVEFTEQYSRDLDIPTEHVDEIVEVAEQMEAEEVLINKRVGTFASAAIYAYAQVEGLDLSQDEVADVTNVTTVTIRNNYKEVFKVMERSIHPSINPPDTVEEGFDRLESIDHVQVRQARKLLDASGYDPESSASKAGIAGGAFLLMGRRAGGIVDPADIGETVGAQSQTVERHAEAIEERLTEGDREQ